MRRRHCPRAFCFSGGCSARKSGSNPNKCLLDRPRVFPNKIAARYASMMWHAQIPIPIADQCFSDSSSYSGILFILQKDRRKFHDVINEHATRRDAKTISSSLRNVLGNVRVAFEDDRREGDTSYSAIAFGICLESHESGYILLTNRKRT